MEPIKVSDWIRWETSEVVDGMPAMMCHLSQVAWLDAAGNPVVSQGVDRPIGTPPNWRREPNPTAYVPVPEAA